MKQRCVAGAVALSLCLGAAAQAQYYYYTLPEGAGPVFRLGVGPSFFQDSRITAFSTPGVAPTGPVPTVPSPVNFDTGLAAEAALGWAFNQYAALDFETGYSGAEINNVPGYLSNHSHLYNIPFLGNFTLSYPIPHTFLTPYVGAGAGGADAVFDADHFNDGVDFVDGSENDVVFAWQAFAGLRFNISRHVSFDVGYKYFATGNPTFTYPPDNFNVGFKGVRTHSVLFAFRFVF